MAEQENASPLEGKRILIVFGSLELGGAERQGLMLARHLKQEHNAHVEVLGFNDTGKSAQMCEDEGIPWSIVPLPFSGGRVQRWIRLLQFILALRSKKPDIILPYTMVPNVCCGIAWRWTGADVCIWNQRDEGRERMPGRLEQWAVAQTSFFVSNSEHGAKFLIQEMNVKPDLVRIIHNGITLEDAQKSKEEWRKQLGVDNAFLCCMVANLSPYKDWETLLKAWRDVISKLEKRNSTAFLLLAGSFCNMHDTLSQLTKELGIEKTVIFLGRIDDITGLLSTVDLAVFSSKLEGMPNGVLEAMAAGLAVVGTDIPGIREAVGKDGIPLLTPPNDFAGLADSIIKMIDDPELRKSAGKANSQRVITNFHPSRMYKDFVELICKSTN